MRLVYRSWFPLGLIASGVLLLVSGSMLSWKFIQMFANHRPSAGCGCSGASLWGVSSGTTSMLMVGIFVFLFTAGLLYGVFYGIQAFIQTRRITRALQSHFVPLPLWISTWSRSKKKAVRIYGFTNVHPEAFSIGWWKPAIMISSGCLVRLSDAEIKAVLEHEYSHVNKRDPMQFVVMEVIARCFFYVPLMASLVAFVRAAREVGADGYVTDSDALGRALLAFEVDTETVGAASFASAMEMRVNRILDPQAPVVITVNRSKMILTFAVAIIVIGAFWRPSHSVKAAPPCAPVPCTHRYQIDTASVLYYPRNNNF